MLKKLSSKRRSLFRLSGLSGLSGSSGDRPDERNEQDKPNKPDQPDRPDLFEWIASLATFGLEPVSKFYDIQVHAETGRSV